MSLLWIDERTGEMRRRCSCFCFRDERLTRWPPSLAQEMSGKRRRSLVRRPVRGSQTSSLAASRYILATDTVRSGSGSVPRGDVHKGSTDPRLARGERSETLVEAVCKNDCLQDFFVSSQFLFFSGQGFRWHFFFVLLSTATRLAKWSKASNGTGAAFGRLGGTMTDLARDQISSCIAR
jgi:hypothetical protein